MSLLWLGGGQPHGCCGARGPSWPGLERSHPAGCSRTQPFSWGRALTLHPEEISPAAPRARGLLFSAHLGEGAAPPSVVPVPELSLRLSLLTEPSPSASFLRTISALIL